MTSNSEALRRMREQRHAESAAAAAKMAATCKLKKKPERKRVGQVADGSR